jgi:hypothetical protein
MLVLGLVLATGIGVVLIRNSEGEGPTIYVLGPPPETKYPSRLVLNVELEFLPEEVDRKRTYRNAPSAYVFDMVLRANGGRFSVRYLGRPRELLIVQRFRGNVVVQADAEPGLLRKGAAFDIWDGTRIGEGVVTSQLVETVPPSWRGSNEEYWATKPLPK